MLMLMSTALWADETVTVSANSSDISDGLDLKVVAKLFAEAKNLEEFETMLNNPDSTFCNLDLNGDGQVDYLRVVETGEGNKRLIVLQAVLAKDIYQDVASIYVEKNEKDEVSVQVVGDEYVYGTNYIIEPVYVYRPVIYDWFWSDAWYAWHSPWYWGYYPGWWYVHSCWAHDRYWHHCYTFHHYHHNCSFRHGREARHGYREMHNNVARRDMATAQPERSFSQRNRNDQCPRYPSYEWCTDDASGAWWWRGKRCRTSGYKCFRSYYPYIRQSAYGRCSRSYLCIDPQCFDRICPQYIEFTCCNPQYIEFTCRYTRYLDLSCNNDARNDECHYHYTHYDNA